MNHRYRLSPEARDQVDAIGAFIAEESVDAALRVYDALEEAFELIADNPGLGHTREDLTHRPVKFWGVFSYLVVYDPAGDPVTIIAVVHGARDVEQLLKRI
ncbi:MAG: type II toxin-antitoxin system RelE/ParE family toxin [Acidobacteria bacterium]|nr:type II toxin-antitoxin system RelE/ParE family toxin [Acidobacteriota bacterium]